MKEEIISCEEDNGVRKMNINVGTLWRKYTHV